jgi:hypothetical protein
LRAYGRLDWPFFLLIFLPFERTYPAIACRSWKISDASELSFAAENKDARSDLEALAALDNNNDGVLNKDDARFGELKVWVDANGNGVTDAGELKTLAEHGITEIGLRGQNREGTAGVGDNVLLSTATFKRENGSTGTVGNVALAYKPGTGSNGSGNRLSDAISILRGSQNRDQRFNIATDLPIDGDASGNIFDYYEQLNISSELAVAAVEAIEPLVADTAETEKYSQDLLPELDLATASFDGISVTAYADDDARRLAIITQDMAAFGTRTGEDELVWRRDGSKPLDYFA